MRPRDPFDFPYPFLAPFRDDPRLTLEENIAAYWIVHDEYFALVLDYLAQLKARGHVVPVPSDELVASLAKTMPWRPGREAEYREWVGVTHGRGVWAWIEARNEADER